MANARQIALPRTLVVMLALLAGGCMHERGMSVPSDATLQAEGDKMLTFRAPEPGTVYVYNRNDDKIVYSGALERNQTLSIDPGKNRITMDGRTVLEKGLDDNETLRIFFKPATVSRERVIVEERKVTETR